MDKTEVFKRYYYEHETGKLYNKSRGIHNSSNGEKWCEWFNKNRADKEVGYLNSEGYVVVDMHVNGKRYTKAVHRICWLLYYGVEPSETIDHINGIRSDNRIVNLRDVTFKDNRINQHSYSFSHTSGVFYMKDSGLYIPYVLNTKGTKKHLGSCLTLEEAQCMLRDRISADGQGN